MMDEQRARTPSWNTRETTTSSTTMGEENGRETGGAFRVDQKSMRKIRHASGQANDKDVQRNCGEYWAHYIVPWFSARVHRAYQRQTWSA